MGILNVTPDSYYSLSRVHNLSELGKRVEQMLVDGVDIIDIGGQSTRPGAERISSEEEWCRVKPVFEFVRKNFPHLVLSADTFYSSVAQKALDLGVSIINDVYAGRESSDIYNLSQSYNASYVLMHSKGNASNMNLLNQYSNVVDDIKNFFSSELKNRNVTEKSKVIIDPGFGFAKDTDQNFELLKGLSNFKDLKFPILVGLSRKKMIQNTLDCDANDALNGTSVLHMAALERGANILRVHDIKEAKQCVKLFLALNRS
jgi:dihydropteroate synthase